MKQIFKTLITTIADIPGIHHGIRSMSRLGLIPYSIWRRLPARTDFIVKTPDGKPFICPSNENDPLGRFLYWRGALGFEPETSRVFYDLAKNSKHFADVGANGGYFSVLAKLANPDIQITSFEPVPRVFENLQTRLKANDIDPTKSAIMAAVSDNDGDTVFHVPDDPIPTSGSLNAQNTYTKKSTSEIKVKVISLDQQFNDIQTAPDLLKIDVEGAEDSVLRGMRNILQRKKPKLIIECNPDGPINQIEQILKEYDYTFYHLTRKGMKKKDHITADNSHDRNWLFT